MTRETVIGVTPADAAMSTSVTGFLACFFMLADVLTLTGFPLISHRDGGMQEVFSRSGTFFRLAAGPVKSAREIRRFLRENLQLRCLCRQSALRTITPINESAIAKIKASCSSCVGHQRYSWRSATRGSIRAACRAGK